MDIKLKVARLNRIQSILLEEMSQLSDEDRDLPIRWNIMHMYSCAQVSKLLSMKRGLNIELAGIIAALHDIGTIRTRRKENHAETGVPCARKIIDDFNNRFGDKLCKITEEEKNIILESIREHSNKDDISINEYVELIKDVDSIDRYLHGIASGGVYKERIEKVLVELGIENLL